MSYKDKKKDKAYRRAYYKAHKREILIKAKKYRKTHKEEQKKHTLKYRKLHREELNKKGKEYFRTHKRKCLDLQTKSRRAGKGITPKSKCINGCNVVWFILQEHHLKYGKKPITVIMCPNCHALYKAKRIGLKRKKKG